jgi:hypothetical protein
MTMAPVRSSVRQSGQCWATSAAVIIVRLDVHRARQRHAAPQLDEPLRRARTIRLPQRRQPVSKPVSAGSRA